MSDPILEAKTVAEMMEALNAKYGLELPTSFPEGTDLGLLWAAKVTVEKDPEPGVIYQATGTEPIPITVPEGKVSVGVSQVPSRKEQRSCQQRNRKARPASAGRR